MPEISFVNLLVVAAVAVLAPLLLGFLPELRLPAVVVEIEAGVILGPSVLGWVDADLPVEVLAVLGLAFLLPGRVGDRPAQPARPYAPGRRARYRTPRPRSGCGCRCCCW